ncbi:MAG: amidohydrolase [Gammaproteobacteria bacterium]|nr:amidohydrolase [Gammaproteobacteria bacterium]
MLIDTHVHLIDLGRLSYPWLADVEALNRDASHTDYARQARQLGITGALHMEVDVHEEQMEAETAMIAELMQGDSLLLGAIAACRPESSAFAAYLERQLDTPHVRGLRRVLHTSPDELSQSTEFRQNIARLSGTRLPFDICVHHRQLPVAVELVDACPDVQFVLDHCGVPDVKNHAFQPWAGHISALAERANVAAKISGVIAYGDGYNWALEDIRPFVEHVLDAFGPERVVWGSDSPVCTLGGPLASWVAATHTLLQNASPSEKAGLFHANARRIWGLPLQP